VGGPPTKVPGEGELLYCTRRSIEGIYSGKSVARKPAEKEGKEIACGLGKRESIDKKTSRLSKKERANKEHKARWKSYRKQKKMV